MCILYPPGVIVTVSIVALFEMEGYPILQGFSLFCSSFQTFFPPLICKAYHFLRKLKLLKPIVIVQFCLGF